MCGYFCARFIDFMLKGKSLLDHSNSFSSNKYKKNQNFIIIFLIDFKQIKIIKIYIIDCDKYLDLKTLNISIICS